MAKKTKVPAPKKPAPKAKPTPAPKAEPKPKAKPTARPAAASYAETGVDLQGEASAMAGLLGWVRKTAEHRPEGRAGHVAVDVGYFASVVQLGGNLGLAVSADGVGTKLLVAQQLDRYDTVGVDLVAMNVNDLICVGAEPITLLDYIAVEKLDAKLLTALGKGLFDGAAQAGITISGGELAQIGAMLRGARPGRAFDVAAVAVGTVPLDRVNTGQDVREGDVVVGFASSGIHSNGLSLARRALLEQGGLTLDDPLPGAKGVTVGDALLTPTVIYVRPVLDLLKDPRGAQVTALAHITGGGFLNMARITAPCGYVLDALPPVPPIFTAIADKGGVGPAEMWAAYNMGVGFTVTLRPGGEQRALEVAKEHGLRAWVIGRAVASDVRRITLPAVGLESDDDADVFRPIVAAAPV
jgi:phosphoribosylformylglycinamidine cyclo-ligase